MRVSTKRDEDELWKSLIIALRGENIVFDSAHQTVSKAYQKLANFSEIHAVDIKKVSGEDTDYYLSLLLKDGGSIPIGHSSNYETILAAAGDLANSLRVQVTNT